MKPMVVFVVLFLCAPAALAQQPIILDDPSWFEAAEPLRIVGPIYYVGTRGLAAYLIATPDGHILLDGAMPGSGPKIEASIRALGFEPKDIRVLLISHAHVDHVGTLAYFKNLTGAAVNVMEADAELLRSGGRSDYLYAKQEAFHFDPVIPDRLLHDRDTVSLGDVRLTARHTPGHTPGCTTWLTTVKDGDRSYVVGFPGSTSINPGTKLVRDPSYPGIADDYRRSFAMLETLALDIPLAAHPSFFAFDEKRSRAAKNGAQAFVDPRGYHNRIADQRTTFERLVGQESVTVTKPAPGTAGKD